MKIDEYKKISDNVQVPDVVWEGYQNAIKQIKMEKETDKNIVKISKWKNVNALAKIAVVFGAVVLLSDRKSTRLNSSHDRQSRMPSSA